MEIFVCKFNMLKKCKIKTKKNKKGNKKKQGEKLKTSKKDKTHLRASYLLEFHHNDIASYARVYQHDVRPPVDNKLQRRFVMRVNQVTTARIRLGIHMPGTVCRAYIVFSKIIIKEVTKPPSLAGLAAIAYIQKKIE